jgi:hypothetical protein
MQGKPDLTAGVQFILVFVNGFPASLDGREFEERIMVPRGIEYMAGGTGAHPTIG